MNKYLGKLQLKLVSLLLITTFVLALILTGCSGAKNGSAPSNTNSGSNNENMMVANLGSEPKTIDPALNSGVDGSTVIFNIFEGLARIGNDDKPEPGLAKSWDIKDGGKTYIFHLRDNLKWSDGSPLTAEDIKYGIMRVLDPKVGSMYSYHAFHIKNAKAYNEGKAKAEDVGVKVIDPKTLEINLEYPVPFFLDIVSWHLLLPLKKDIVEKNPNWASDPKTVVSNGPFKLVEWKHNDYMLLEKNPYYWDADNVKLEKLKLVMITDSNTALTAFQTGKVDLIKDLPPMQAPELLKSGKAHSINELGPYFLAFNTKKKPLDNPKVRQALSLAIDRQAIVDTVLKGGQQPATAYIPPQLPGGTEGKDFRSEGKNYIDVKANVDQARKLLAEAGYPDGKGFPKLTYTYNESNMHKAVAEALQAMWKKNLGIDVDLQVQEWKVFLSNRVNGNYDIARHGYIADFNDVGSLFELWVKGSPNNDVKYNNAEYDKIVAEAAREQDPVKRSQLYHQAEDILMRDMPIAPLFYYNIQYMIQPYVKGMHLSPLGWDFFRTVEIKK